MPDLLARNAGLPPTKRLNIAVVAPSNRVDPTLPPRLEALAATLYGDARPNITFAPQCFESCGHFAGPDATRAAAFIAAANDPAVDVVWFGRGGYGSFRLAEAVLAGLGPAARDKIYMGYSDAGALLGALYAAGIGRVAHGPMPSDLNRDGGEGAVGRALAFLVEGDRAALEPHVANRPTAAFNITILAHLVGTPFLPDLRGHVLMVEEIAEPMYRIDRDLGQILSAPALRGLAGLRLGRCGAIPDNDPDFVLGENEVAQYWCARAGVPWLGHADIGHDVDNTVVPFGLWGR